HRRAAAGALARADAARQKPGRPRRCKRLMSEAVLDPHAQPSRAATARDRHDVVITGGGLAGLTLALQLKQSFADLDILVVERRLHPVPIAAHKVGESTVEIGAHYLSDVLGLKHHLETAQLKKFGFRFFSSEGRRDIDAVTEIGASRYLSVPSWQLDRGILENFLAEEAVRRGVRVVCGATVRDIALADDGGEHAVVFRHDGVGREVRTRWLVDACGRAGLIKKKRELAEPN